MPQTASTAIEGADQVKPSTIEGHRSILSTKLFVPSIPANRVERRRMMDRLNSGLDKALVLISAPAGYGKTTLVSGWLNQCALPSAWLSLDKEDNDPVHFLQYLIIALQKTFPAINLRILGALQDKTPESYRFLVTILINEMARSVDPFILVLDDFHTISAQPVLEIITYFLEHLPPQTHLIIVSRSDPLLPLARLRARNQLIEIRADQLRFSPEEIALFLNSLNGLKLLPRELQALEARTEGWIAGLQLAAIALQASLPQQPMQERGSGEIEFISAFTGSHYYIMDYLTEEVLKLQTDSIRSFLLKTSILDRMCGPLCDFVIDSSPSELGTSQAVLEALEQKNLFIIPLDTERRWYRYHHLFADVLNRRLQQDYPHLFSDLHRRASQWFERNHSIFDAVRHALLAKDYDRAAHLVDRHGCQLLMSGEVINLLNWIEEVEPYAQALPWIAIQKGWAMCITGQPESAERPLQTAGDLLSPLELTNEVRIMLGALAGARAYQAALMRKPQLAAQYSRQALDCLPTSTDLSCSLRSAATSILGDASWIEGNLKEAQLAYVDAIQISQAAGNPYMNIIASQNLAEILMEQGQLHAAAKIYGDMLRSVPFTDGRSSPLAERAYLGLGLLAYQRNELETAEELIDRGVHLSRQWEKVEFEAIGKLLMARIETTRGNADKARGMLPEAEAVIANLAQISRWWSAFAVSSLAQAWISVGNLDRAASLIDRNNDPGNEKIPYLQEPLLVALMRLRLARGDYGGALSLSDELLRGINASNRAGRYIEILVLRALAFQGKRSMQESLAALDKALSLPQSEGYKRVFIDEGEPMAKLLYQIRPPRSGAVYAAELLSAMSKTFDDIPVQAVVLIEPLTPRELEVLKLIESGCANLEIATRLVISLPTVKRHISNIYMKLGAESRTQAIARGRELKLFD